MIGQTISHYKITEKLGEGGMGVVYKARDTKLDRDVALKFLPESLTPTEEHRQRFIREAKAAAALSHPNICMIYNIDEHGDTPFIVMEYIEGKTLRAKIDGGELSPETALGYGAKIADALGEAHKQDIIHRDIKPENIMVDAKDRIKVMDFGLAKLKQGRDITKTGDTVGTLAYMSPEQIRGQQVDHRSDLFSLGILLYEMLTGTKPFQGEHQAAMTYSIVNEEPEPLETYLPEVPEELTQIIDRLLAKDPEDRLGSGGEVAELLDDVKESYDMLTESTRSKQAGNEINEPSSGDSSTISITLPGLGFGKKKIGWKGLLASVTVVLAVVLFLGWWLIGESTMEQNVAASPGGEKSEIANHSIAVLPFEVSGAGAEEWKDGMVTALSLNLDGAAGLRAIPDRTIFAKLKQKQESGDIGTQKALDVAREVGARYAVVGSAVQLGENLRFGVDVRDVDSGKRLGQVEVRGAPDSVTELTNKLTRQILGVLLERSDEAIPSVNLESITTESLPALKAFLAGERHFRSGKYEEAITDYEKAIERDSTFALAYTRLSRGRGWFGSGNSAQPMKKAYQLSDQLPRRERRLVEARYLWVVKNDPLIATDSLRQLTKEYPDDPLMWNQYGEVLIHGSIAPGWPGAEEAFGKAIELDPGQVSHHNHYVELAFALHHDSTLAAKRIKSHPGEEKLKKQYRISLDLIFGNKNQKDKALSQIENIVLPDYNNLVGIFNHPFNWHLKDEVLSALQNREDIDDDAFAYHLAFNSYQQGHLDKWISESKRAGGNTSALLSYANSQDLPIQDSLVRQHLEPGNLPDDPPPYKLISSFIYLIDQGRNEEADELMNRFKEVGDSIAKQDPQFKKESFNNMLQGYQAWKSGDLKEAEKSFSRLHLASLLINIWRGDVYRELGKFDRAEEWYLAAWSNPISHERLGMLYEQMDKPEKAAEAYRRFIVAWKDADPDLQDRVEQARQRLEQLSVSEKGTTEEVVDVEE